MSLRDLFLSGILFGSIPFILKRPAIGALIYAWVSIMTPHRLTWGFAYNFPFAMMIAMATLVGIVVSREPKRMPVTGVTAVLFLFVISMNLSTLFAFDQPASLYMWDKAMKIQLMIFVTLFLLHTRDHIKWLVWIVTGSIAYFCVKGGVFTLMTGGGFRVYGPEGFIAENNALALATIMIIPLMRYIQLQMTNVWVKWGLTGAMLLSGFSALGSHSRGALIGIAAMLMFLWVKSRNKMVMGMLILMMVPVAIAFMPANWEQRMMSIQTYDEDGSAMGRINAWMMAWNLAKDNPLLGGGFDIYNPTLFARYAPNPLDIHAAHSIYFQVLGEHGFVGLGLFLLLWFLVWRDAAWVIRHARKREGWNWAADLASMIQVSLIGYFIGGAFLSLAYFDLPYYLLVILVLMRVMLSKEIAGEQKGWMRAGPKPQANAAPGPVSPHPVSPRPVSPSLPGSRFVQQRGQDSPRSP